MRDLPLPRTDQAEPVRSALAGVRLSCRNLTYDTGNRRLLDAVSLDFPTRGISVVMGPNGAGKSLLLRLLHGLVQPDSGEVLWNTAQVGPSRKLRQAMVFQKPVLLRRSVAANIDFVLRAQGRRDPALRERLLQKVALLDRSAQPARLLSGGEQQRLALARALATQPELLFLDEPTASLDPASAKMIEEIVQDAVAQGTKVIFVTHDVAQARRLAQDVAFLSHGVVCEHRSAQDFFSAPDSQAARDYLAGKLVV